MKQIKVNIDSLIDVVKNGGAIRTGVDIYNKRKVLLLEKSVQVKDLNILLNIKRNGVTAINFNKKKDGGIWDLSGKELLLQAEDKQEDDNAAVVDDLSRRIDEIREIKREASVKFKRAKESIKTVLEEIKNNGGEFDFNQVERAVTDLYTFVTENNNAFSYLTKEIFTYDDYLYNHSINVCTIGMVVLNRFNKEFSGFINKHLPDFPFKHPGKVSDNAVPSFVYYLPEDLYNISLGFFLHDLGKVLVPRELLNKKGMLTKEEFEIVKSHSFEKGIAILEKNSVGNTKINTIVRYHHSSLYYNEENCYPTDKMHTELPPYVKICKLADIYDAMTSRRSYKNALNPVVVVSELFGRYANKDRMLQFILHAFLKAIGIYPPGSIVYLMNGQVAYVMDSAGPIVIAFADPNGNVLKNVPEPFAVNKAIQKNPELNIDRRRPLEFPHKYVNDLPYYLRN